MMQLKLYRSKGRLCEVGDSEQTKSNDTERIILIFLSGGLFSSQVPANF